MRGAGRENDGKDEQRDGRWRSGWMKREIEMVVRRNRRRNGGGDERNRSQARDRMEWRTHGARHQDVHSGGNQGR